MTRDRGRFEAGGRVVRSPGSHSAPVALPLGSGALSPGMSSTGSRIACGPYSPESAFDRRDELVDRELAELVERLADGRERRA